MSKSKKFAIVDISILQDKRLGLNDLRVFIALLSFMNNATHSCFPSRRAISERCGLAETRISTITSKLEKLGFIQKIGRGGHSRSTTYIILKVNENVGSDCAATQPDPLSNNSNTSSSKTIKTIIERGYYETNQQNCNRNRTNNQKQKISAVERVRHANATAIESYEF